VSKKEEEISKKGCRKAKRERNFKEIDCYTAVF
jgi:hypothetical protein